MKKNLGVIFGGTSTEKEVSVESAKSILKVHNISHFYFERWQMV